MQPRNRLQMIRSARTAARAMMLIGVTSAVTGPAAAQVSPGRSQAAIPACAVTPRAVGSPSLRRSGSVLEQRVEFQASDMPLTEALDRLGAVAGIRLSYSRELLPPNVVACVAATTATVGDVITHLLRGSDLEAVEAGDAHIVLRRRAPAPAPARAPSADSTTRVQQLERVVVSASAGKSGVAWSGSSGTTIVDHETIGARDFRSLAEVLGHAAPGVWVWEQPASVFLTQYGSLRGASSFGASSPKIYIDGIEVANPLLVTLLDPEHIARIELVRGPQGAALHGPDALSGVVNITTRREGAANGGLDLHVRSSGGVVESRYVTSPLVAQSHSITLRAGSEMRSLAVALAGDRTDSYLPGGHSRQVNALVTGQRVGSHAVLGATARLATASGASPAAPFPGGATQVADTAPGSLVHGALRQYTLGFTAEMPAARRWHHSVVAGIDGYRLSDEATSDDGASDETVRTRLSAVEVPAAADRVSLRASSVYRLAETDGVAATLTFRAEHAALRQMIAPPTGVTGSPVAMPSEAEAEWRANTGLSSQLDMAVRRWLFLTGGLRMERLTSEATMSRIVALPMVGAGVAGSHDDYAFTVRGAYGRGVRAARANRLEVVRRHGPRMAMQRNMLLPEEQEGTEASIRIAKGQAFSLQLTRFDQLASGLVQPVSFHTSDGRRIEQLQNVGEIANRGWEIEQSLDVHDITVSSTLSLIDSRVRAVASGYDGELRAGDRTLGVPALTASVNLGYSSCEGAISVGLTQARDWVGYDMLTLQTDGSAAGVALRDYWRTYSAVTGLRASVSRDLTRNLRLVLTGDNLLDVQRGAPDNATLLPGRTTTLSLRAVF